MKYNATYTPLLTLKDTILEIDHVIEKIHNFYNKKFSIIQLIPPLFLEENSDMLINHESITRPITFDMISEYKVGQLILSHSNWLRKMINKIALEPGSGFRIISSKIWRDNPISPVSSVTKNEIIFQIRLENNIDMKIAVKKELEELYKYINNLEVQLSKKYSFNPIMQKKINFISAQTLESEFPTLEPKKREKNIINELNSFVLKNSGDNLFSGLRHSDIPVEIYAQKNHYEIMIKNIANSESVKVASVSQVVSGLLLEDQLAINHKSYLKEANYYVDIIKNNYNIIEIKIDVDKLMFSLLQKGHISEVQAEVTSNESKIIETRYKIEKF